MRINWPIFFLVKSQSLALDATLTKNSQKRAGESLVYGKGLCILMQIQI